MKASFLMALLLVCCTALHAAEEVKGNGKIVTTKIEISDYDEIKLSGTADVQYTQMTGAPSLELTIDENLLPYLKIEVKNRQLTIGYKSGMNLYPTKNIVKTHSKWLKEVKVTGTGGFYAQNPIDGNELELKTSGSGLIEMKKAVKVSDLTLNASGSGNIVADNIQTGLLECKSGGSGNIRIGGKATTGSFSITGSGDLDAFGCTINELNCKITGSGNANVHVTDNLKASVIGSGNIRYKGTPAVTQRTIGSGSIQPAK